MKPNVISIDGLDYVRKDTISTVQHEGPIKICVLQRGFVLIGHYKEEGTQCTLTNSSIIRRYGTTKGLGELAADGKLKDTILDKCNGVVQFDKLTLVFSIDVNQSKWVGVL